MKVILAALLVFTGTMAVAGTMLSIESEKNPIWLDAAVTVVVFLGLLAGAFRFFNSAGRPRSPYLQGDSIEKLEAKGLLLKENFQARRAFQIEEWEDEGSQYMIELQDGSVLFLIGQYLYEYEPITDDPELNQPRQFPCTDFTVRRHKEEGYIMDILCRGEVLEPECLAPAFDKEDFMQGWIPEDGQMITDKSYDELKRERMKRRQKTGAGRFY